MEASILTSTKKILGIEADYTAFDLDIITHINSVFVTLNDVGIGPPQGFMIEDAVAEWDDYLVDGNRNNDLKSYMWLRVRLLFDPPTTSFLINSLNDQANQILWRVSTRREDEEWVDPNE